jgi:peptidoglycan/LPS O-acetylase OafA/YrhL
MEYRREIDGLRALAILPVIFFHAGFAIFSGGYVGVDIFFVISGYLITAIIIDEMDKGTFSLLNFYERRARRILPALFFVMLCTLPFAWYWMLPDELKDYSKSLVTVPLFASNVIFYLTSGYFDTTSEFKPLLHTWSLAIEEQYYILFPIFLLLTWKLGKKTIASLLFLIGAISLLIAQWGSVTHPTFSFYLLPTRGFEILIGSLIYFFTNNKQSAILINQSINQLFSLAGMGMVLYAIFSFDKETPHPSIETLIPTIGAGLVLAFSNSKNLVGKFLGNKLFVGVGLISYSAYLWHQPIIAFSKIRGLYGIKLIEPWVIIITSLALAFFSWKFIENPFRNKKLISRTFIIIFSMIGALFFIVIGTTIYLENGLKKWNNKIPPNIMWLSMGEKIDANGDICKPIAYKNTGISTCNFGDLKSTKNIILYGDSHSQVIEDELNKTFKVRGIKGIKLAIYGCEVIPELKLYKKAKTDITERCNNKFKDMLSYIKDIDAEVIVVSRWTYKLYPIKGQIDDMTSKNSEGGVENNSTQYQFASVLNGKINFDSESKKIALNNFLDGILSSTKKLYLIYPVPEISWDIVRKNIVYYRVNGTLLDEISIPYSDFKKRNGYVYTIFNEYKNNPRVVTIKPENIFCNSFVADRCVAQYETTPFYYDDDHLSDAGAHLLVEKLSEHFK